MSYELVKPLRGRVNALRAVKKVKSFLTPEGADSPPLEGCPQGGVVGSSSSRQWQ
jgi:hypothetical protein